MKRMSLHCPRSRRLGSRAFPSPHLRGSVVRRHFRKNGMRLGDEEPLQAAQRICYPFFRSGFLFDLDDFAVFENHAEMFAFAAIWIVRKICVMRTGPIAAVI